MSTRRKKLVWLLAIMTIVTTGLASLTSCGTGSQSKIQLKVYAADSLIIPFQDMAQQFELKYPNINVLIEGHGSIQVIRSVTELHEDVDVAAVADSQLIRLLMYDTQMPDKNGPYANWCIDFATNSIGIAYTDKSLYSREINDNNWYEIMSRPDVKIGLSDPRIDSLGYRALMVMQLAESYYQDSALIDKMIGNGFTMNLDISTTNGLTTIKVPEIMQPAQDRIVLRTYSLQVLALLESGDVDYSFEYESVAKQHGFKFLQLPPAIDLSSQDYADVYKQVRVTMDFQRFATVNPEFQGAPVMYGVTIPNNAEHPQEAAKFLEFILSADGQSILSQNYQPPLIPAKCDNTAVIPDNLRRLFE